MIKFIKKTCVIIFVCLLSNALAQEVKFGKVTVEELNKTACSYDKDAHAEITYIQGKDKIEFNKSVNVWQKIFSVKKRIKIYDKDKLNHNFLKSKIYLYKANSNQDSEKLSRLHVSTYNLVNGKVEETKMSNSDVFTSVIDKHTELKTFAYPKVQNGSIIEIEYEITGRGVREIENWYFQSDIPVAYSEHILEAPEFFVYYPDVKGGISGVTSTDSRPLENSKYSVKLNKMVYKNVKSISREPFVMNLNNLKASVRYELYQLQIPGEITENYAKSWDQIATDLLNNDDLGRQLMGTGFLTDQVKNLTDTINKPEGKMLAIFNQVKNSYKWDDIYGKYAENGIRKTFNSKTGNVADLNLLLIAMLREAGLNANPVVLSSVRNGILNYAFPSMTNLDYLIADVTINGNQYLMDATEPLSKINMLPKRALNYRGIELTKNKGQEISLINAVLSEKKLFISAKLDESGQFIGSYSDTQDNYLAIESIEELDDNENEFKNNYVDQLGITTDNLLVQNNGSGMIRFSFKFDHFNADNLGGKLMFNPFLFISKSKNEFQLENRNYQLEFGSPIRSIKIAKITIPDGYTVENSPKNMQFKLPNDVGIYGFTFEQKGNVLEVSSLLQINSAVLPMNFYKSVKELYNNIISTETQQVVLVKK